jgi:adenylate cyclase
MGGLSGAELARLAGSSPARVDRLVALGILPRRADDAFTPPDIQRVRLAEAFDSSGVSLESIGRAIASGHLSFDFVDSLFPQPAALSGMTFEDAAEELGVPTDVVVRLYAMWGLPRPNPQATVREDDAAIFADVRASLPEPVLQDDALTRGARILGDATHRVADATATFFRSFFEEPAIASGAPRAQIIDMVSELSARMTPALERWLLWLLHRHFEHNQIQYIVEHVEMSLEEAGVAPPRPQAPPAIAFLDLTAFTTVTEERGDEAAADFALRLAELVADVASLHGGRPVKLLGDGVMFHFTAPGAAVLGAFDLIERTGRAGLPPARVGIAAGPVVLRDGDYFGRTVNLAARIADYARPREVLVTPEVRQASDEDAIAFEEVGAVSLKGVQGRVSLLSAAPALKGSR